MASNVFIRSFLIIIFNIYHITVKTFLQYNDLFYHLYAKSLKLNISAKLATRYIFGKKSSNVINIISAIAVFGIAIGTAALILVLSVFNGFEDLISGLFQKFNPDVKITPVEGKTFREDTLLISELYKLSGVKKVSKTLEDLALFEYQNSQTFGVVKGVDDNYKNVTSINSSIIEGRFDLRNSEPPPIVLGAGLAQRLAVDVEDKLSLLRVYTPKRQKTSLMEAPFITKFMDPVGVFAIQQEFDQEYTITSLPFARELFDYTHEISALEIKLDSTKNLKAIQTNIEKIMGPKYSVKDRFRQDESFLKLMNIEKWMSYAIVCLTLLLVSFNMIGALWMIVLDKRQDIAILKALGLHNKSISSIFINSGMLLSTLGLFMGFIIAIVLYILQTTIGIVTIPEGFVVDTYPISLRLLDFIVVGFTVLLIGFLASIPSARKAATIQTTFND